MEADTIVVSAMLMVEQELLESRGGLTLGVSKVNGWNRVSNESRRICNKSIDVMSSSRL